MNKKDDLDGKAAELKTSVTPLGNDDYLITINLKVAIPVFFGLLALCISIAFFLWSG